MNFLIIEFLDEINKIALTRSLRVLDGESSLKILFLTYRIDILNALTGESHSIGDFITQIDKKCKIINNGKVISSDKPYSDLDYVERETDVGVVQLATIQVSLKKDNNLKRDK